MIAAYSFIGPLPNYCIETVHQLRSFFNGEIYFIVSDYNNLLIKLLETKYNVKIIKYDSVVCNKFNELINNKRSKFLHLPGLIGRENLFIYSFERFFVLYNLMIQRNLSDVFFLELDNLVYDDPINWLNSFKLSDMSYMFDNIDRASSGIAYIKNIQILKAFLDECSDFITNSTDFMSEMSVLYRFQKKLPNNVKYLPVHWKDDSLLLESHENIDNYNSIFDAASIGIFLGGLDMYHTNGKLELGKKNSASLIDYTNYKYEWKSDENGRKIPYIYNPIAGKWLRINNLHIHSKILHPHLSLPL